MVIMSRVRLPMSTLSILYIESGKLRQTIFMNFWINLAKFCIFLHHCQVVMINLLTLPGNKFFIKVF